MIFAQTAVKVGIYNNEPLISVDRAGKGKGIFADILEYVAAKEGWQLEYVAGTWPECLSRLETHQIDILCAIAFSEERDRVYDFTQEDLVTNWGQLFASKGSGIKTITDLADKKLALLKGDIHGKVFGHLITKFGITCEIIETPDYKEVLKMLSDHRQMPVWSIDWWVKNLQLIFQLNKPG